MSAPRVIASRRSTTQPAWLWEGVGYLLAVAVVGTELIARLTLVVLR